MKREMSIRYYVVRKGHGYWQPTKRMRDLGFNSVPCGPDGPAAWARAEECNAQWASRNVVPLAKRNAPGFVYFLKAGDAVKIGFSANPFGRAAAIKTGMNRKIEAIAAVRGTLASEQLMHKRLAAYRRAGEWFTLSQPVQQAMLRALSLGSVEAAISSTNLE